jgi:CRISPR-associated exonuclease Cas4
MDDIVPELAPDGGDENDEVLISAIEHYSYCPRQCALIHVEQTYDENVYTIRGSLAHERVDDGDSAPQRGMPTLRAIPLWSERYGLRGKADVVEWHGGVPYPVEHKVGRRHGRHADLQLCAQALCLEEMLSVGVPLGAISYGATRRRHEVVFNAELREQTVAAIRAVRAIVRGQVLPPAPNDARCPNCSLIHACLPGTVAEQARLRSYQQSLFVPLALAGSGVDDA